MVLRFGFEVVSLHGYCINVYAPSREAPLCSDIYFVPFAILEFGVYVFDAEHTHTQTKFVSYLMYLLFELV